DNCWLVSCRAVIDAELIVIGQRIDHLHRQITGISLFHIRTEISEANCLTLFRRYGFDIPVDFVKAFQSTVQVVAVIVLGQFIPCTVEIEYTLRDSVAVKANKTSEEWGSLEVGLKGITTHSYLFNVSLPIRYLQRCVSSSQV